MEMEDKIELLSIKANQLKNFRDDGKYRLGIELNEEEKEEIKHDNEGIRADKKSKMKVYAKRVAAGLPLF